MIRLVCHAGVASTRQADFFGLDAGMLAPEPEQASKLPEGKIVGGGSERTSNPSAVREFLHGSSAGAAGKAGVGSQYGMDLPLWDTADEEAVKQAAVFSR